MITTASCTQANNLQTTPPHTSTPNFHRPHFHVHTLGYTPMHKHIHTQAIDYGGALLCYGCVAVAVMGGGWGPHQHPNGSTSCLNSSSSSSSSSGGSSCLRNGGIGARMTDFSSISGSGSSSLLHSSADTHVFDFSSSSISSDVPGNRLLFLDPSLAAGAFAGITGLFFGRGRLKVMYTGCGLVTVQCECIVLQNVTDVIVPSRCGHHRCILQKESQGRLYRAQDAITVMQFKDAIVFKRGARL